MLPIAKSDGDILRSLGLMLQREEGVAHPVAVVGHKPEWVCAWCQQERGEKAQSNQTHGICDRHKAEMIAQAVALNRRAAA